MDAEGTQAQASRVEVGRHTFHIEDPRQAVPERGRLASWPLAAWQSRRKESGRSSFEVASLASWVIAEGETGQQLLPEGGGGLSVNEAVITVVINCVGIGVVMLPKIIADMGPIVATLLCCICAMTCHECGVMISTACTVTEEMSGTKVTSYEALASLAAGPVLRNWLMVTKNTAMLGFIIAYAQLIVDSFASFLPGEMEDKPVRSIRFLIVLPILGVLAMITNLKQIARFAGLGLVAIVVKCLCIVVGGVLLAFQLPRCSHSDAGVPPGDFDNAGCREYSWWPTVPPDELDNACGKYLAIFLFMFAILATVPSLRSQLSDSSQMHTVLRQSFSIITAIDVGVMFLGYLGFARNAPENAITGLTESYPVVGLIAAGSMIVNILVSYPLFVFCVMSVFESMGSSAIFQPLTPPNVAVRLGLVLALNCVGAALPYVTEVIGLVSSVFACCNNILFPVTFHISARYKAAAAPRRPLLRTVKYVASIAVGLVVLVFGFLGSLETLLKKMNSEREVS